MTDETRSPAEWEQELNIKIIDADGWTSLADWNTPITREEFDKKMGVSTVLLPQVEALSWHDDGPGEQSEDLPSWDELIAGGTATEPVEPILDNGKTPLGEHIEP